VVKVNLNLHPSEYIKRNMIITTSGVCDHIPLRCSIDALGLDNVLFSVDYPYESSLTAAKFIESAPISSDDKEKICFKNAQRILKISLGDQ
jgi:2,3-dihydroxybenzoate decarboxylase